ncbi:glycosyltransferase [Kitasatospora sp. NBC_01560]|uniref:glycosyltransferase family 2 protein n=1 Tax=Kitasatospora sp. NBC_01560 TaxID=2975965 RepID=UPI00386C13CF
MSRFEILLPYYGDVRLMQDAVRSVLVQGGDDWRLTVVDDGKEPDVPGWFESLGDPRVRYFRNEQNLGVSGNFNRCVELAEYEHLVLMGCDDLMHPNYLKVIRETLERFPDAGMVQPGVLVIDGDGKPVEGLADAVKRKLYAPKDPGPKLMAGEPLAISLMRGNWLYFPSICWRTKAVQQFRFRTDLGVIQDLALILDLLLDGQSLAVTPEVCFSYRRHAVSESSATAFSGKRFEEARRFFREAADRLDTHGWHRAATVSRRFFSSRLHALTMIPAAGKKAGMQGVGAMLSHVTGRRA